jgi:hypothetical protein
MDALKLIFRTTPFVFSFDVKLNYWTLTSHMYHVVILKMCFKSESGSPPNN